MIADNNVLKALLNFNFEKKWVIADHLSAWFFKITIYISLIKFLDTSQYGEYYKYLSLIILFSWVVSPLLIQSSLRLYLDYKDEISRSFIKNFMHLYFLALVALLLLLLILILSFNIHSNSSLITILILLAMTQVYMNVYRELVNLNRHRKKYAISHFIGDLIKLGLILFFLSQQFPIELVFLSIIISDFIQIYLLRKYFIFTNNLNIPAAKKKAIIKKILTLGWPLMLLALVGWVSQYSDRYIIEFYLGLGDTGKYLAALHIVQIPFNALVTIFTVYYAPIIYKARTSKHRVKLLDFYNITLMKAILTLFFVSSIFIVLTHDYFFLLFGAFTLDIWSYLLVLISTIFFSLFTRNAFCFLALKDTKTFFIVGLISSILTLIIYILALSILGFIGSFLALILSKAISFLISNVFLKASKLKYL